MKLVTKTNRYYLIFFVLLFPLMIGVDYYVIQYAVIKEVDEILENESERIIFHLHEKGELPSSNYVFDTALLNEDFPASNKFNDTLIYDGYTKKLIPYRTYKFTVLVDSQRIKISIKHILMEMNELIIWLFISTTMIIFLVVTGLFIINQGIYKWAWKPFFERLSELKNYNIAKKEPVRLEASNISEFEELNEIVTALMNQVKKDFQNLKEFNENISHEIQTPLTIIRNKMVMLLDSKNLDEHEFQRVHAVYQEVNKLSKISKSLTLISRIENQEYKSLDTVEIPTIIDNIVRNMEEMINFKNLKINMSLEPVTVECDQILANILFTNLIKNAVQHNQQGGGYISMSLTQDKFVITNTGQISDVSTAQLFNRFQKGNSETDSLGLGLSINQKICEIYGFQLDYNCQAEIHTFSLFFKRE